MIEYFANQADRVNINLRTKEKIERIKNHNIQRKLYQIIFPFSFPEAKKIIENLIKYEKMLKSRSRFYNKNDLQEINKIIIDLTVSEQVFQIN